MVRTLQPLDFPGPSLFSPLEMAQQNEMIVPTLIGKIAPGVSNHRRSHSDPAKLLGNDVRCALFEIQQIGFYPSRAHTKCPCPLPAGPHATPCRIKSDMPHGRVRPTALTLAPLPLLPLTTLFDP